MVQKYKKTQSRFEKIMLVVTIGAVCVGGLTGCKNDVKTMNDEKNKTSSIEIRETKVNGFTLFDISIYQKIRLNELIKDNNLTDYTYEGNKKNLNYTAEDYKKIPELDETYFYRFYCETTEKTFNEVLRAFGYTDLDDFLTKKGYVDKSGKPSVYVWFDANNEEISEIMKEIQEEMTKGKE